ncbi:MAG: ABC transporter permease [Alphaproteobacteria bacterium]|nr:ABC transporter permease [Alphaproteobacteria bacterium]
MTIVAETAISESGMIARPRRRRRGSGASLSLAVGCVLIAFVLAGVLLAPWLTGAKPLALGPDTLQAPGWAHPMGTDDLGRDVYARVLYGGRVSLMIGVVSAAVGVALGTTIGLIAGFVGGATDEALMRFTEAFQILPRLLVTIVVVALLGGGIGKVIMVIGFLSWPATARVIRSRALVLRSEEFMAAAVLSGASWLRRIVRHALPNVWGYLLVSASLQVASAVLSEAFLSFLGLGDPDRPSWGFLLQQGQLFLQQAWWLTAFPGLALAMIILGLNLLGDGLATNAARRGRR